MARMENGFTVFLDRGDVVKVTENHYEYSEGKTYVTITIGTIADLSPLRINISGVTLEEFAASVAKAAAKQKEEKEAVNVAS